MIEIERKFLIKHTGVLEAAAGQSVIKQGYLSSVAERTVRIRIKDTLGFLTIKGKSNESGTSRLEWERKIPYNEALSLLELCEDYVIEKTRYLIKHADHIFEVDVFEGNNKGLILVEVELNSEDEFFEKPDWLGQEVTGDVRYYNSYLSNHPFTTW